MPSESLKSRVALSSAPFDYFVKNFINFGHANDWNSVVEESMWKMFVFDQLYVSVEFYHGPEEIERHVPQRVFCPTHDPGRWELVKNMLWSKNWTKEVVRRRIIFCFIKISHKSNF